MATTRYLVAAAVGALCAIAAPAGAENDATDAANLVRGAELYKLCAQCHGPQGGGEQLSLAPNIAGLPDWYIKAQLHKFKSGLRGIHPGDTGGMRMYPMSLTLKKDADIEDVAAYVASLPREKPPKTVEGNAEQGKALYTTCAACHGPDGGGNQAMNAPPLAHANGWYLVSTLEKYKAGIRGGNPQNTNSVLMRGMAAQLPDQQAIKNVVAYIETLN